MKTNITKVRAAVFGTMLLASAGLTANAQLMLTGTSYVQNFNGIANGLPTGWSVRTGASATALGTDVSANAILTPASNTTWNNQTGGFKNFASGTPFTYYADGTSALQGAETNRALGVRQIGMTDLGVAFVLEIANTSGLSNFELDLKIQSLDSTSPRLATWLVDYATGSNPSVFIPATVTGMLTTGGLTYSSNNISVDFGTALDNHSGPVYIRIATLTATSTSVGSGNRPSTAIDDLTLSWTGSGVATNILATNYTPTGNNVPLSTSQLTVKYDNPIAKGTGNFTLIKHGSAIPVSTINVASADVTIANDSTAVIDLGAYNLENNSQYFVHANAGVFTKTGGTLPSIAIVDSTTWMFSTVDTVTPPPPTPLTSLDETFTTCDNNGAMGIFVQHSEFGANRTWRCSNTGRTDSRSVYMNGGSGSGSEENKDWLISNAPFDFSAMANPALSFYQKRRFNGTVTRSVMISTDHVPGQDPAAATWTAINVPAFTNVPDTSWSLVSNISLNAHKATPFFLAFVYESPATGSTWEWTLDDIKVANATSIRPVSGATVGIQVLGEATTNHIDLNIDMNSSDQVELELSDLVGRKVASQKAKLNNGPNRISMSNLNLGAGMYVIRVIGTNGFGTVKAVVK